MLNTFFTIMALLFIVSMVIQIFNIQAFFSRLEKGHKKLYEEMQKPKWRIQLADDAFKNGLKFIRSRSFESLNDAELTTIYKRIKLSDYIAIASAVTAVGITLYQAIIFS